MGLKIGLADVGVGTSTSFPPSRGISNFVEHSPVESSTFATPVSMSGHACISPMNGEVGKSSGVLAPSVERDAFAGGWLASLSTIGEKVL